jgi:hypothetical protein
VKVAALPAIIGVGEALLVIRRSAPAETLTVAVAVLFPGTPSGTPADRVATLVILPLLELCTRPTIVSVLVLPLVSVPALSHVTVVPAAEQAQPPPEEET